MLWIEGTVMLKQINLTDWFKKRTFHHSQFNNLTKLVKAKEKKKTKDFNVSY